MAFAAVSAAAAIAVFGLTKGSPGAQKATAAFVDPSQAPGEPAPAAAPLGTTAPSAPQGQAAAPAVAQGAPAPGLTPADLLAQPAVSASAANMALPAYLPTLTRSLTTGSGRLSQIIRTHLQHYYEADGDPFAGVKRIR